MKEFQELCEYKKKYWKKEGKKFSSKNLAKQFIQYWESGEKIKVKFSYDEIKTGTVGITTGWSPVFLLMLTSRSKGSSTTLGKNDKIIAVGREQKKYLYSQL